MVTDNSPSKAAKLTTDEMTYDKAQLTGILTPLPPFLVSATASVICYAITGATLGLFLGPLVLNTILLPPLVLADQSPIRRLSSLLAVLSATAIVWLATSGQTLTGWHQVLTCVLVMGAWLTALAGGTLILRELRVVPALAWTLSVLTGLVWLTWPIWLSPVLASHQRSVGWLTWAHPIIAMNSVVRHLGMWGSPMGGSDLAYKYLTVLNQDVAYPQSGSVWPMVALHGGIGLPLVAVSPLLGTWRRRDREGAMT